MKQIIKLITIFIVLLLSLSYIVYADDYRDYLHNSIVPKSLQGDFNVDINTGAATYSYPVKVLPGTNTLQPVLNLDYNSFNTNSYPELVGSGWGLTESYIQRDVKYTPLLTEDDEFRLILNGQAYELVYVPSEQRFHTKIESYLYIKKVLGGENSKGEYWEVKTKDGMTYRFGYNKDSELVSNMNDYVWRWYLDLVTDTHQNNIYYSYKEDLFSEDIGVTYLKKIEYDNDKKRKIEFSYLSLPTSWIIFDNGHKMKRTSKLKYINTYFDEKLVRKYTLTYTTNTVSTRSYISSITEESSDGSILPSTTFSYNIPTYGWSEDTTLEKQLPDTIFSYEGMDTGSRLLDINRDGRIDIIQNINHPFIAKEAYLNSYGGNFIKSNSFTPPSSAKFITEFDDNTREVGVRIGDFNGDNYPDLIKGFKDEDNDETYFTIWSNTGVGWTVSDKKFISYFSIVGEYPNYKYTDNGVELIDLNSDGFDDALKGKEDSEKKAWINYNGEWAVSNEWQLPSNVYFVDNKGKDLGVRLIDINGDGLVDIYKSDITTKKLWLNTGSGWFEDTSFSISSLPENIDTKKEDVGVRLADVNGDGLVDVLFAKSDERITYLHKGNTWSSYSSWNVPTDAEFVMSNGDNEGTRLADINSDGSVDIVRIKDAGSSVLKKLWLNKVTPFLLRTVKLSDGGEVMLDYINSAEIDTNQLSFNMWIVKSVAYTEPQPEIKKHHEFNSYLDCIPDKCSIDYQDFGVACSENECKRSCKKTTTNLWNMIKSYNEPWSEHNFDSNQVGETLFSFFDFKDGKAYKIESWSDTDIVKNSDIDHENDDETDSVIALKWRISNLEEQPWGSNCKPGASGNLLNKKDFYLIDDKDEGDNYNDAGVLGGTWTGYCMPTSDGCNGYSPCTIKCYGNSWGFGIEALPDMPDNYKKLMPDDIQGACNSQEIWSSDAETDYIDFKNNVFVGMNIWEADIITKESDKVCTKVSGKKTEYTYSNGLYDYEDKEFRGFGYVEEKRPDESLIKHYFHQDDARAGKEYKTELLEEDLLRKYTENGFSYILKDNYFITTLDNTNEILYDKIMDLSKIIHVDYIYDSFGNIIYISNLGDTSKEGDEKHDSFEYIYNEDKWLVSNPSKHTISASNGLKKIKETYYTYNEFGDKIKEEYWLENSNNPFVTYTYDNYGNMLSVMDANGHSTKYEYDDTHTFVVKETNAKNQEIVYNYNFATGNLLSETDANGYTTNYVYDTFGRKIKEIYPYDSEESPTIEYLYDFDGISPNTITTKQKINEQETFDKHEYSDGFGNIIQIKTKADNSLFITKEVFYDSMNRISQESDVYYSSLAEYSVPNEEISTTDYAYDIFDRQTKIKKIDNNEINMKYELWTTTIFDENNHRKDIIKDAYGNIIEIKEYNDDEIYTTTYEYDIIGNLINIVDNEGNQIKYTYDTLGRKTSLEDPDLGYWTYEYDSNGNLIKQKDNNDNTIEMTYDELNRITSKTTTENAITYVYDKGTIGTLSSIQTTDKTTNVDYDERLRIINEEEQIEGIEFTTAYIYDSMNRLTSRTLSNNEFIEFSYDAQGNLNLIQGFVDELKYNEYNVPTKRDYANNQQTEMTYDSSSHRLTQIKTDDKQELNYQYDSVGNVLNINDKKNKVLLNMEYDNLDRLTHAIRNGDVNSYDISYNYNSISNILKIKNNVETTDFIYQGKPIHSPTSFITFSSTENTVSCQNSDISCDNGLICKNNQCIIPDGCAYNNPTCGEGYECMENECILIAITEETGCAYNNQVCGNKGYECVNNECVPKEGCNYGNPICGTGYECQNNQCVLKQEKKVGCSYNNPSCNEGYDCINNECVLKQGCNYNNPPCEISEECVNNICIGKNQHDIHLISFKLMPPTLTKSDGYVVFEAIIENIGEAIAYNIPWKLFEVSGDTLVDSGDKPIEKIEINEKVIIYPVFKLNKCPLKAGIWFDYLDKDNELSETNNVGYYEIIKCNNLQEDVFVESINTSTENEENTGNPYKISEDALITSKDYSKFYNKHSFNEIGALQDKIKDKRREKDNKLPPAYNENHNR